MGCERYEELMSAALDGELSAQERRELDRHLARCPACGAAFEELRAQCAALRELDCSFPEDLHDKILGSLPEQEKAATRRPTRWRRWGAMAACMALIVGTVWAAPMLSAPDEQPVLASLMNSAAPSAQDGDVYVGGLCDPDDGTQDGLPQRSADSANLEAAQNSKNSGEPTPYAAVGEETSDTCPPLWSNVQRLAVNAGGEPAAQIVDSAQEMEQLLARFPGDDLSSVAAEYDVDYFQYNWLLAVNVGNSGRYEFTGLELPESEENLDVCYSNSAGGEAQEKAGWLILAEPVCDGGGVTGVTFEDDGKLVLTPCEGAEP